MRRSDDLEVAETLSEPVRVNGEVVLGGVMEEEIFEEDLGEEAECGERGGAEGGRVVRVRLKEEEAVFRAKLGSADDEEVVALCRGVTGALMLPPPPPPPSPP